MKNEKRLWLLLIAVVATSFGLLGFFGREIYRQKPPLPARVVTDSGVELWTEADILDGQQVWQGIGGQQIGSIWGHGAYQAPDWSADWLHREAEALLERLAFYGGGASYAGLSAPEQSGLRTVLVREMRTNT